MKFRDPLTGALVAGLRAADGLLPESDVTYEDEPSGDLLVDRALAWLDEGDGPFFLYLHLMEPHTPYAPPSPFRERFDPGGEGPAPERYPAYLGMLPWDRGRSLPPDELARLRGAYDGEVATADAAIGKLLDGLAARGRLEDTLVTVLSDHGEEFQEHGAWGHGHSLYREVVWVPWILRLPGDAHAGRRVPGATSTADLMPTILDLLGLTILDPAREPDGLSLGPVVRGEGSVAADRVVVAEVRTPGERLRLAATDGRTVIAHEGRGTGGSTVYDLGSDPGQARGREAEGDRLERSLRAIFEALGKRALGPGRAAVSEEEREALRGLGYAR
jgi:arylsulfatase A-like enzyme